MVQSNRGVLITSDEASITFLCLLDESSVGANKFIVARLDSRNLFIKAERLHAVQERLAERLRQTTFDDEDAADAAQAQAQ